MSTLLEIEAAVEQLPSSQQEKLFAFLADKLGRHKLLSHDPVDNIIGAYSGEVEFTGRQAEDILYGPNKAV